MKLALFSASGLLSASLMPAAMAQLSLPAVVSDGMVLQRESSVPIWGWAKPGAEVSVKGGWMGSWIAADTTTADETGRWQLMVRTPEATTEATSLSIWTRSESLNIADVHVGEVLLCSGQSNMEWELHRIADAVAGAEGLNPATKSYDRPDVHYFTVQRRASVEVQNDCAGTWRTAQGQDAMECSAVAYFTACALQDELGVPVGLINTSWGGTPVEAWTSRPVVERFPRHARTLDLVGADDDSGPSEVAAEFWSAVRAKAFWSDAFVDPRFDDSDWTEEVQPSAFKDGFLGSHDGVAWYRRTVSLPRGWKGEELTLSLPPIDDLDGTYVNGTLVGSTLTKTGYTQPRSYRVPAPVNDRDEMVIAICCLDTGGGGGFGSGGSMMIAKDAEGVELSGPWRVRKGLSKSAVPEIPYTRGVDHWTPSALYGGMIEPVRPYGVRGMLWYQGEANVAFPDEYRLLFPAMIVDWRERWGQEVPFYLVQLAPFDYGERGAKDRPVARLRDAQASAMALPMVGMALTNDIGNPKDIHPVNKWEVGRRLALWILRDHFGGETDPVGPAPAALTPEAGALRVTFDHAPGGLRHSGEGPIAGFEVLGEGSDEWAPATAELVDDGAAVVLRAEGVSAPTRARYLWSDAAQGSLLNGVGIPIAPFESR